MGTVGFLGWSSPLKSIRQLREIYSYIDNYSDGNRYTDNIIENYTDRYAGLRSEHNIDSDTTCLLFGGTGWLPGDRVKKCDGGTAGFRAGDHEHREDNLGLEGNQTRGTQPTKNTFVICFGRFWFWSRFSPAFLLILGTGLRPRLRPYSGSFWTIPKKADEIAKLMDKIAETFQQDDLSWPSSTIPKAVNKLYDENKEVMQLVSTVGCECRVDAVAPDVCGASPFGFLVRPSGLGCTDVSGLYHGQLGYAKQVMWQVGFIAVKVGEATNTGPLEVLTTNVTSLGTQAGFLDVIHADVVGLQEARLSELG